MKRESSDHSKHISLLKVRIAKELKNKVLPKSSTFQSDALNSVLGLANLQAQ